MLAGRLFQLNELAAWAPLDLVATWPWQAHVLLGVVLAAKQQDKWRAQMAHASGQCNAEGVPLPPLSLKHI